MVTSDFRLDVEIWPSTHCGLSYEADSTFIERISNSVLNSL